MERWFSVVLWWGLALTLLLAVLVGNHRFAQLETDVVDLRRAGILSAQAGIIVAEQGIKLSDRLDHCECATPQKATF
jgi:hypothetical protein